MSEWYTRYLQGRYQEVYDELLGLQEHIFDEPIFDEAVAVVQEMMRRVRYNIELITTHLNHMGYRFGEGFWDENEHLSIEEKNSIEQDIPIFKSPTAETPERISYLERLVGPLPLSLLYWYKIVGSVNLIGSFPSSSERSIDRRYGSVLDPLFIYSVDMAIKMVSIHLQHDVWERDPTLSLSPDNYYKYSYSGKGAYSILLPCKAFDAILQLEQHHLTFINYLRLCLHWGGFPGLEQENRLTPEEFAYLKKDLLPF